VFLKKIDFSKSRVSVRRGECICVISVCIVLCDRQKMLHDQMSGLDRGCLVLVIKRTQSAEGFHVSTCY